MRIVRMVFIILLAKVGLWSQEYQVISLLDVGPGTLRDALESVEDGDSIVFASFLFGPIKLLSPLPQVNESVVIQGPSSGKVWVSGESTYPIFHVKSEKNVEISDLHVARGKTTGSGAGLFIEDFANVKFTRGSFSKCQGKGTEGGAVHIGQESTLMVIDTPFYQNASGGPGEDIYLALDSSLIDTANSTLSAIEVFGTGFISKHGPGSATFIVPSSTALTLVAQDGETISTGVRTAPTIVQPGARLVGSQSTQYLINSGTVKPSEGIGTFNTTGDYFQGAGASLEIALTPNSNDLLDVGSNAYLSGSLMIDPQPGNYSVGTTYTILNTGGFVNQQFNSVTSTSLTFDVHYFSDSVQIEITGLN